MTPGYPILTTKVAAIVGLAKSTAAKYWLQGEKSAQMVKFTSLQSNLWCSIEMHYMIPKPV